MSLKTVNQKTLLSQSSALNHFQEMILKESSLLMEGLWDAPKAALIFLAAQATGKNILVITGEKRESRLVDDLEYFHLENHLEFPSWETLPGEEIAPSPDIVGRRFEILYRLAEKNGPHVVLCPLQACLQRILAPNSLKKRCKLWEVGSTHPFDDLEPYLSALGYRRVAVVSDKGEFALRNGILDLFPLSSFDPYRIEFFGDQIESIRTFDPIGQKSINKVDKVFISPASEPKLLQEESDLRLIFDYLGQECLVIFDDLLAIEDRYVSFKQMPASRSRFFASIEEIFERIHTLPHLFWSSERIEALSEVTLPKKMGRDFYSGKTPLQPLSFEVCGKTLSSKRWLAPFREIGDFFSPSEELAATTSDEILRGMERLRDSPIQIHFICVSQSEENAFKERLANEHILLPKNTLFERGYLSSGFALTDAPIAYLPMTELTHRYRVRRQKWRGTYHTPASDFHELKPGDIVVHFQNGIGKYLGVEKKTNHLGVQAEFLLIEFAENSKLYVPIASAHLISRYIGAKEEIPVFSELGTQRWHNIRIKAEKAIIGYAHDLLRVSAEREVHGGFTYPEDSEQTEAFEQDFPFVETEDQLRAIEAIKQDMRSSKAMDRLICGDVGYGKTEVAMRAAFKAVADGKKQVAVLVPTTVLAMQHYENFRDRMANYPINIAVASRFQSPKTVRQILEQTAEGKIDILVGTHRIISKDVRFKDLGLIVIDEEQRFGVRAKEHLKKLKTGVDCLTLTATPIPRTLYLSLMGARDISIINTPPQDRLPIKTHISPREPSVIQNALLRELSRDGQAFFIHNRVESIFQVTEEIQKLLPEARIVTGHGQMSPDEIDTVFHAFKSGEADILIATTIVENGIDIPNANTILIDRADQFGLADLYQMRGRVGRWNRPAFAYFLTPKGQRLPEISQKRLMALVEASGHGGGMKIAMRDLEIRGAGDILGTQQSGQISAIGFHLYCKLLKRTVDALHKKQKPNFIETKMEFSFDARLDENYIAEPSLRMEMYHRLGAASGAEEVDALLKELQDRFGTPPPSVIWLYHLTRIRLFASTHYFTLLKFDRQTLYTEKQKGKEVVKRSFLLPKFQSAHELEQAVIAILTKATT